MNYRVGHPGFPRQGDIGGVNEVQGKKGRERGQGKETGGPQGSERWLEAKMLMTNAIPAAAQIGDNVAP
jgi:hypothetical protein